MVQGQFSGVEDAAPGPGAVIGEDAAGDGDGTRIPNCSAEESGTIEKSAIDYAHPARIVNAAAKGYLRGAAGNLAILQVQTAEVCDGPARKIASAGQCQSLDRDGVAGGVCDDGPIQSLNRELIRSGTGQGDVV